MKQSADAPIRFEAVVPQFTVPDVVSTAEYYRDVLGFHLAGYWDGEGVSFATDPPPGFAILRRDKVAVFLRADESTVLTARAPGAYDAYFHVSGVDALAADLRARGADILEGPEDRVYEQRELVVKDCNGMVLAFGEDTSGRNPGRPSIMSDPMEKDPHLKAWPKGIAAITLFVEDLEAAKEFYGKVFGLPVVYGDKDSAVFKFGGTLVNLLKTAAAGELIDPAKVASREAGSRFVFTIGVDDVDAMCAELTARGVTLLNGPMDRPWGVRTASFADPGGHIWEIAK